MASQISDVSSLQVKAEKDRLIEAKLGAESEKRLNVEVSAVYSVIMLVFDPYSQLFYIFFIVID